MIRDRVNARKDELNAEAQRPRVVFLVASAISGLAAVGAYFFELMQNNDLLNVLLVGFLIFLSMFLVLCYRNPALGNRFLGYDVAIRAERKKEKSSLNYAGTFEVETGLAEKRMASRRKQARHSRKKLAEVTRQMQAKKQTETKADE